MTASIVGRKWLLLFCSWFCFQKTIADAFIQVARKESDKVKLSWSTGGSPGPVVLESTDSLGAGNWVPVPGINWPQTISEFTDTRPFAAPGRFYRLVIPQPEVRRGRLITVEFQKRLSKFEIQLLLAFAGVALPVSNDVNFYKLEYETVGLNGESSTASGALAIPEGVSGGLPLVSYQHGTELDRTSVPSAFNSEAIIAVTMAASGYVCVAPDYLGLGTSSFPFHPYHHAASEATAVVDMLRAARQYASLSNVVLNGKVLLFGYSQGGHATLAAHREIERVHSSEFNLLGSAPGAGAYDLSGVTLEDSLSQRRPPNPYYYAYILGAYQQIYHLSTSLASILRPPYDVDVPPLLDGHHSGDDLNAKMPAIPSEAMAPSFAGTLRSDSEHPFRKALRENDLLDWAPKAPVRLYHCVGDQDVLYANSEVALARLKANGAKSVELFNGGAMDHGGCVSFALLGAKAWFDTLK